MKRLNNHAIGIDQGEKIMFSDFEDGGEMWTGTGPRERREPVVFAQPFQAVPSVHVSLSLWDVDSATNVRADVVAERVTETGFEIVFRTWGDTKVARVRVSWMSIGELPHDDEWQLY